MAPGPHKYFRLESPLSSSPLSPHHPCLPITSLSPSHRRRLFVCSVIIALLLLCPRPVGGGALSGDRRPSSVRLSVCLMSRTSALTRKPKGLGRLNFAQGYPRSHATPTPTSRSKGQKSRSRGGGILWRPPSGTACYYLPYNNNNYYYLLLCVSLT